MRIAILSDIHGNRTAFEAVLNDLRAASPDLILHGGDLADFGSRPVEIVDQIRDFGWPGVLGNTDEMHVRPESLDDFAACSTAPASIWDAIREMREVVSERLGMERIAWLAALPGVHVIENMALVHASPESLWQAPPREATDSEMQSAYGCLEREIVVYGHIHQPFVRRLTGLNLNKVIVNSGSVGLSYDGDPRAAYLLLNDFRPEIRRVEYSLDKELRAVAQSGIPHADWIARTLNAAAPQML
ncbi:MAG TPA: metallophosphoesterase family protein [Bryobacteraceae bacterium]|jgi:predicted phosphodiesterase|nr:metallophosphoesterase family protein [Bryobacteraceae bacterium]